MRNYQCCAAVLGISGAACLVVGMFLIYYMDTLVRNKIAKSVTLEQNGEAYNKWADENNEIFIDFYFFNVTNVEEMKKDTKIVPKVEEIGPYVYKEIKKKIGVQFSSDNGTLSYIEQKYYIFNRHLSNGLTEEDTFFTLNMAAVIVSEMLRQRLSNILLMLARFLFESESLYEEHTVKEMLWGYNATLATKLNTWIVKFGLKPVDFPLFGLYTRNRANGSSSLLFNISTGVTHLDDLGMIQSYNESSDLPYWFGKTCNVINGSDGTLWHPFVDRSQSLNIFSTETCRSFFMNYDSDDEIMGLDVYKFVIPPSAFKDFRTDPLTRCFCVPNVDSCLKKGVLDVSVCNKGAPIILSMPHFLNADDEYIDAIKGVSPDLIKHRTYINVEPFTGRALSAHKRLQINLPLKRYECFPATLNIEKPIIFPMMWADEHGALTKQDAEALYKKLYLPMIVVKWVQYILIILGGVCLLAFFMVLMLGCSAKKEKHDNEKKEIPNESTRLVAGNVSNAQNC